MPVYRYRWNGPVASQVQNQVPGTPTVGTLAPAVYTDVTVAAGSKADLDEAMAALGYVYDSQDPVTTTAEQTAASTVSSITVSNAGVTVGKRSKINLLGPVGAVVDDPVGDKVDVTVVAYGAPTALTVGGTGQTGTASSVAHSDHTHTLPAFGTAAGTFAQGNDSRLSDARTPTSHAASHASAGSDAITVAQSQVTNLTSDLAAKAADSAVVHNTGAETVAGVKTFSSSPIVPTPTLGTQAANMGYVDSQIAAVSGGWAPGVQTIATLRAVGSAARQDKQLRLVEDAGSIYRFDTAGLGADDGDFTIIPSDITFPDPGRWFKAQSATQNHEALSGLLGGAAGDHYHLTSAQVGYLPTAGQKQALAGTSGTPATGNEYVTTSDSRMTNARTPTSHASTHAPGGADAVSTGVPVAVGTANSAGTGTSLARNDHVHAHGSQTDGTHHAVASGTTAGFMSSADFTKLSGVATGATNTPLASVAPTAVSAAAGAVGVGTTAARHDHTHQVSTGTPVAIGTANSAGSGNPLALANHVHDHGAQTNGSHHAVAIAGGANGFLSGADKTKIDRAVQTVYMFGNSGVNTTTTTRYLSPGFMQSLAAGTAAVQFRSPVAATLSNLYVVHGTPAGNGNAIVYTVRVNGVASALTASVASTAASGSDTTHTVAISAGDLIDIQVTKAASIVTSPTNVIVTFAAMN